VEANSALSNKEYPEFHRRVGPSVWFRNSHYAQYMVREWTSFFVATFCLVYIYEIYLLSTSPASYSSLIHNTGLVFFNILVLAFTLYHAATWFYLTGRVQPIKIGKTVTKPWQALIINVLLLLVVFYVVVILFGLK
jgi:fumarate reductase subunit C